MLDDDLIRRMERAEQVRAQVEPMDGWVAIEPVSDDQETRNGLILPATTSALVRSGVVLAVGADVEGVAPGDRVLMRRDSGYEVRLGGEKLLLVERDELVARYAD